MPGLGDFVKTVISPVVFPLVTSDPDSPTGKPLKYRYMIRPGIAEDGTAIITRYRYNSHFDELITWDDPRWTDWIWMPSLGEDPIISFEDLEPGEIYLIATQVMDQDGAVSLGRGYQQEVINIEVATPGQFRPSLMVSEVFLGSRSTSTANQIAAGQTLQFSWVASADHYGGTVVSYRHGWDLLDIDDPYDPGWAVPPGLTPQNLFAQPTAFNEGTHKFYLRVEDNYGNVTRFTWTLLVIPFISPEYQYPLMVVDQVVDSQTNAWPGPGGFPAFDREEYRNAFWQFLQGQGGVYHFNWDEDRWDHTQTLNYSDMVWYRAVLIYARSHSSQTLFTEFRAVNGVDKFVWLAPYQFQGGNIFLVGSRSMESFLEVDNYMVPIIFDTEEVEYVLNGVSYVVGFGQREMPDGSLVDRGPMMYPYWVAGISVLDWTTPVDKYIYARPYLAFSDRGSKCAGLKNVVLDQEFRSFHFDDFNSTDEIILPNSLIDWRDDYSADSDSLNNTFYFSGDEFVDANITERPTLWASQECDEAPAGLCVEPMFRVLTRYDWLRERKWAEGDTGWPQSQYSELRLNQICGPLALEDLEISGDTIPLGTARTNGKVCGFLSYKNVAEKPSSKADVYWGFDPYRFDTTQTQNAIRDVLRYFGLQINQ